MKKRRKGMADNYQTSVSVLQRSKWFIVFGLGVFLFSLVIGFGFPFLFREQILEFMANLVNAFEGKTFLQTTALIFWNNVRASFFAIALGAFFGIFPLVVAVVNGYLVGFTSRLVVDIGKGSMLWRFLPHGIFEFPAILFSIGIGMRLGLLALRGGKGLKKELNDALIFFLFIIVPFLILAAIIETGLIFLFG